MNCLHEFTLDRQTKKVVSIDHHPLLKKMSFHEFFDTYLNQTLLIGQGKDALESSILSFIETSESGSKMELTSIEGMKYGILVDEVSFSSIGLLFFRDGEGKSSQDFDFLTGVYSRSYLFRYLGHELRKDNQGKNAYLLMMDLDGFKLINDSFGHVVGDVCLKSIAEDLNHVFNGHLFGRYGGDEFIGYVEDITDVELEKLVRDILDIRFFYEKSSDRRSVVTCSCGVVKVEAGIDIYPLIEKADKALYLCKKSGKNFACIFPHTFIGNDDRNELKNPKKKIASGQSGILFKEEIRNKKRKGKFIIFSFVLVMTLVSALISHFFANENSSQSGYIVESLSRERASDIAEQMQLKFDDLFGYLDETKNVLEPLHPVGSKYAILDSLLGELNGRYPNVTPALLLDTGEIYDSNRKSDLSQYSSSFTKTIILEKERCVDRLSFLYKEDQIAFGIPSSKTEIDDKRSEVKISGVIFTQSVSDFSSSIFLPSYTNKQYLTIVEKNGNKICESKDDSFSYFKKQNILQQLASDDLLDYQKTLETSLNYPDRDVHGYRIENDLYFFYTCPLLKDKDWILLIVTPNSVVRGYLGNLTGFFVLGFNLLAVFATLIIIALFYLFEKSKIDSFIVKYLDPLTGSINEQRFFIDGKTLISRYGKKYYMVFFNLRGFKYFNKENGTEAANNLLILLSRYLESDIGENELLSREYSDRFICLLYAENIKECEKRIRRITSELHRGSVLGTKLNLVCGIYPIQNRQEPVWLSIDRARIACEQVQLKTGPYRIFDEQMMKKAELEIYIEQTQERALKNHEFAVYYQGKFDMSLNRFVGAEALVRWNDSRKGFIPTQAFVDVLERNGFIQKLDLYVFEEVLNGLSSRIMRNLPVFPISVNVSRRHFDDPSFFDDYLRLMEKYHIDGKYIEFEITESVILDPRMDLSSVIEKMHAAGCKVSIDDFGSGYSNLGLINSIDFDVLKIDRNLLTGRNGFDSYAKSVLKSVVDMNRNLHKTIICEGVENKEEADYLKEIGCYNIQGYYFSKPVPYSALYELIDRKFGD